MTPNSESDSRQDLENGSGNDNGHEHMGKDKRQGKTARLPWRQWIDEQFNWAWFTATQSTGAIAILLSECPKQFDGLRTIGKIVFIFNLVLYLVFIALLLTRWTLKPSRLKRCFIDAPECFFFGSFWLTAATIIICIQSYAVPSTGIWTTVAVRVLFWMYAGITICSAVIITAVVAQYTPITAIEMNPAWFILIFEAMLTGTVASSVAQGQPPEQRLPIIVAGVAYQGLGWIGSLIFLAWFFGSLLQRGWGAPSSRPSLFLCVGASGFTTVALIGNARALPDGYGYFAAHPMAKEVLVVVALWAGIFMWLFTFWIFAMAALINLLGVFSRTEQGWQRAMHFKNAWWAIIFPNAGFALATVYIGQELESNAILWVSVAMIILLVFFWLMDLLLMAKSIFVSLFKDPQVKLM